MWESKTYAQVDSNESKSFAGGGGDGMNMLYHAFMKTIFFFFSFFGISNVVQIWWQLLLHILCNFLVPSYIKSYSFYFFEKL